MMKRLITAILGIILIISVNIVGGIYFKLFIVAVSLIALYEFLILKKMERPIIYISLLTSVFIVLPDYNFLKKSFVIFFSFLVLISYYITKNQNRAIDSLIYLFGLVYIPFTLSLFLELLSQEKGKYIIWLPYLICWGTDTFAYFIGITFGRHKLCSNISPKKSIEGLFGGIFGGLLASFIFWYIYNDFVFDTKILYRIIITGFVLSIIAQIGDLFASMIKRENNVKDFGYILPGHGGVLDRFDSILFVLPAVYFLSNIMHFFSL